MSVCEAPAAASGYPLGYESRELDRLARQAEFYEELTTNVLVRAGVGPGMRVLDVGCGVGDVSLIAARLVGPQGCVVGIDRSAEALATARVRAGLARNSWVRFESAELETFETAETFDAIVGRFVLVYLRNAGLTLRRLVRSVRGGGIVAFQEMDIRSVRSVPELPVLTRMLGWMVAVYERAGLEPDMGTRQARAFVGAGLPAPQLAGAARIEARADDAFYAYFAETVRSALPLIERFGIASAAEVGIDTLARRFRDEAVAAQAVVHMPTLVGAWTTIPA